MPSTSCILAVLLFVLTLPLLLLWNLSLTPEQRVKAQRARAQKNAKALRGQGLSYRAIGARLNVSHTTARRWVLA